MSHGSVKAIDLVAGQKFKDPEYDDVLTVERVEDEDQFAIVFAKGEIDLGRPMGYSLELIYDRDHWVILL